MTAKKKFCALSWDESEVRSGSSGCTEAGRSCLSVGYWVKVNGSMIPRWGQRKEITALRVCAWSTFVFHFCNIPDLAKRHGRYLGVVSWICCSLNNQKLCLGYLQYSVMVFTLWSFKLWDDPCKNCWVWYFGACIEQIYIYHRKGCRLRTTWPFTTTLSKCEGDDSRRLCLQRVHYLSLSSHWTSLERVEPSSRHGDLVFSAF